MKIMQSRQSQHVLIVLNLCFISERNIFRYHLRTLIYYLVCENFVILDMECIVTIILIKEGSWLKEFTERKQNRTENYLSESAWRSTAAVMIARTARGVLK